MQGLAEVIEAAIRFPGFAFVNVRSPCVTFGDEDSQVKHQRSLMKSLVSLGHDPANRLAAMALATQYASELHTGVLYRNPSPPPTLDALTTERQRSLGGKGLPRERILEMFTQR
jgi:2-oxoglutarate ferredoxin oxidoreductase subunit beta